MKLFNRKSPVQRLGDNIKDSLDPGAVLKGALPGKDKTVKAGLAAGGLTALTAASAAISSHRRRQEGASDDS